MSTQLSYQSSNTLKFRSFEVIFKLIGENGGQIVDLDEPKLTHVIIDKRDDTRRLTLMSQTAKYVRVLKSQQTSDRYICISRPKRRRLVIAEFVQACLDEGTLLDEEGNSCS